LEVTTSSTDGDFVDLAAEDESVSETTALSGTHVPAETDAASIMPSATASDDNGIKMSVREVDVKSVTPCVSTEEPADVDERIDGSDKDCSVHDTEVAEVQFSEGADEWKPAQSSAGSSDCALDIDGVESACAAAQLANGRPEVGCSADVEVVSNDDPSMENTVASVDESSLGKSGSDAEDDMDVAESSICENTDYEEAKLSRAMVVLQKLDEANVEAADSSEKSKVSTTSSDMNGDNRKVTGQISQKPKVMILCDFVSVNLLTKPDCCSRNG